MKKIFAVLLLSGFAIAVCHAGPYDHGITHKTELSKKHFDLQTDTKESPEHFTYIGSSNIIYYNGVRNEYPSKHFFYLRNEYMGNGRWLEPFFNDDTIIYGHSIQPEHMPTIGPGGDYENLSFAEISKIDTVKGWIRYWIQPHWESMELNRTNDSVKFVTHYSDQLQEVKTQAIAIYDGDKNASQLTLRIFDNSKPHPYDPEHGYLLKILANEKEFDLSKKYEFIKDEEVVK